jgi:hypothetical protein
MLLGSPKGVGLQTIIFERSKERTRRNFGRRLGQLSVVRIILVLQLLNDSASAFDEISVRPAAPEFYPQSLGVSPHPVQIDLRHAPAHENAWGTDTGYKFDMKFKTFDAAQPVTGALQGFAFPGKHRERNDIKDLRLNLSTFDDWVRFSVRQSQSFYAADADYLRMLASRNKNRNSPGKERFLLGGVGDGANGTAGLERLDVNVFRSEWLGASVFASHGDVDANFVSLASEKSKDEFAVANRSSNSGGGKISFGPFSLTASYTVWSGLDGTASPTEARQDHSVAVDLTDVRKRLGEFVPSAVWALAPSGIYVGTFSKETSYDGLGGGEPDQTTGVTAGAYWTWARGNANVSYWSYDLDSRRVGDASYDSLGRGLDASVGFYGAMLQYYGGISYRHSEDLAPLSRGVDNGYDAYSSVTYKPPAAFPDIVVDGAVGRYDYQSVLYNVSHNSTYWSAAVGLDLSKFLWDSADHKQAAVAKTVHNGLPSLKVFYRYTNETDRGNATETRSDDHLFGMMFRIGPAQWLLPRFGTTRVRS